MNNSNNLNEINSKESHNLIQQLQNNNYMSYTSHMESGELDYPSNINFHTNGSNKDFVPTNQTPTSNPQSETTNNRDQFKQIDALLKPSEEGSSTNIPQVNNTSGNNSNLMNNLNQQYNLSNNSQGIFFV